MKISFNRVGRATSIGIAIITFGISLWLFYYSDESFRQWAGMATVVGMIAPRVLWKCTSLKKWITDEVLGVIELIVSIGFSLNGIGALGFYTTYQYYDMVLHFTGPLSVGIVAALVLGEWYRRSSERHERRIWFTAIAITVVIMILWEVWEYVGDIAFGTEMFGQATESYDTLYDILAGFAALLPLYYFIYHLLEPLLCKHSAFTKFDDVS